MRRILSFFSVLVGLIGMALSMSAPVPDEEGSPMGPIPTWNVGDAWSYTESGTYQLLNPEAQVELTEDLTYTVTSVTDTEYIVAKTSSNVSGNLRYSILNVPLCEASDTGTLRVRRSDLRVISEQRVIKTGVRVVICLRNAVAADLTLVNLGIGPSLYDFPLIDGNAFSFNPGLQVRGTISVNIPPLPPIDQVIDTAPDVSVSNTVVNDSGNFSIQAALTVSEGSVGFTDFYNPAIKTYNKQTLAADIPGLAVAGYSRDLTGSSVTTPPTSITLNITGPGGDARARRGEMITLSGTIAPPPPAGTTVTLRQPEFNNPPWTAMTDAGGNYTTRVMVPDNFMDNITRPNGVLANAGIIASAGNAYTVSTLTVLP